MTSTDPTTQTKDHLFAAWGKRSAARISESSGFPIESTLQKEMREIHLWLGIFNAMTPAERDRPWMLREPSRAARVAGGAGTDVDRVEECVKAWVHELGLLNRQWVIPQHHLCATTHAKLLVGNCPWCGCQIVPDLTESPAGADPI